MKTPRKFLILCNFQDSKPKMSDDKRDMLKDQRGFQVSCWVMKKFQEVFTVCINNVELNLREELE
ncbi:hypothetical protein DRN46_00850 [Thermococci archaeon]|nr:MAG: hypothetical protein DRN46_00850 [Thermococci archaeon]